MVSQSPSASAAIRRPVLGTLIAGTAGTVWGAVVAGVPGLIAGVMATAVVLLFFGLGQVVVQRVLANNPALGLNVALGVYLGQVVVLFVRFFLFYALSHE